MTQPLLVLESNNIEHTLMEFPVSNLKLLYKHFPVYSKAALASFRESPFLSVYTHTTIINYYNRKRFNNAMQTHAATRRKDEQQGFLGTGWKSHSRIHSRYILPFKPNLPSTIQFIKYTQAKPSKIHESIDNALSSSTCFPLLSLYACIHEFVQF